MKKLSFLLVILAFALMATAQQNFEIITKKPVAGSTITIEYMPRNTVLQGVKDFEATAYLLEGYLPVAKTVVLKQEGGIYRGTVKTNDTTKAVFFSFAKDEVQDNNNDEGYYTVLHDKKGNAIAGSNLAVATVFSGNGGIWGLKRNMQKAAGFSKTEFADPVAKAKYYNEYFTFLGQSTDEANKELLKAELAKQLDKKDISENDLQRLKLFYINFLKDKEKSDAILVRIKERYPNGAWKRNEALSAFSKVKSLLEKETAYNNFVTNFPARNKADTQTIGNMASGLARLQADSGNYTAVKNYLDKMPATINKAYVLNGIAWKLAGEGMTKKPLNADLGLALSKESLDLIEAEKKTLADRPTYLTQAQYVKSLVSNTHMFGDTYATLLYHKGDLSQAYAYEKAAVEFYKYKVSERNEAFAFLTEKLKGDKEAQTALVKFFEEGKYTPAMKEQLQRLYTASGKSETQWTAYITNLEEQAYNKMKAELAKTMINIPAPQFALKDMSGKEVALSSLKGKTVVVDFWATWCGPCIASFPGMQKAVNKFKAKDDVVFLFIDTWENDSNRTQKVTEFIAKNKYSFNVLYDDAKAKEGNDFVVVQDFKVEGIPTKFVIDRNSNIRFKTVGYSGSADAVVNELSAMIDMVGAGSGAGAKKAF